MVMTRALLVIAAPLAFAIGACTRVPTETVEAGPAGPAYDSGHTFGSGNRHSQNTTTAADPYGTSDRTGYIGGGGRVSSVGDGPSSDRGIGMIGGGRSEEVDSTVTSRGVLIGSGH